MNKNTYSCFMVFLWLAFVQYNGLASDLSQRQNEDEKLYIGAGELINSHDDGRYGGANYKLTDTIKGAFDTNTILVLYSTLTRHETLPSKAILILSKDPGIGIYESLGDEAWRGILPDTSDNRALVASPERLQQILKTPDGKELPEEQALTLFKAELLNRYPFSTDGEFTTTRYAFGWKISLKKTTEDQHGELHEEFLIYINDEGEVVRYNSFQPMRIFKSKADTVKTNETY